MSGERYVSPVQGNQGDVNGDPIPGAKLYFYDDGTTNPKATYSDVELTKLNPNPVIADGAGRFTPDIFLQNSSYRVTFTDASDVIIWTKDDVNNIVQNTTTGTLPFPGMVVQFWGTQDQLDVWLSNGWLVCDGNNGTPNLDEKYIKGTTNIAGIGTEGGSASITPTGSVDSHVLTVSEIPSHTHTYSVPPSVEVQTGTGAFINAGTYVSQATGATGGDGGHVHGLTMNVQNNEPPFYQLINLIYLGL